MLAVNSGFVHQQEDGLHYYTINSFTQTGMVKHGFSTRLGGVSIGECGTMNLGFKRNDQRETVVTNFNRLCIALDIPSKNMVFTDQVHQDRIAHVRAEDRGKGFNRLSDITETDGFITDTPGVALVTFYADCVPLYFLDVKNRVIGLSHSGWRGTVDKIGLKTFNAMKDTFGTHPKDCLVGIGPSIGDCCFEVDKPVAKAFVQAFPNDHEALIKPLGIKYYIDLWQANRIQFKEASIPNENITVASVCTCCNKDVFFSHRGDCGRTGSMAAILMLNSF